MNVGHVPGVTKRVYGIKDADAGQLLYFYDKRQISVIEQKRQIRSEPLPLKVLKQMFAGYGVFDRQPTVRSKTDSIYIMPLRAQSIRQQRDAYMQNTHGTRLVKNSEPLAFWALPLYRILRLRFVAISA
jgi:hypothetical protein